MIDCKQQILVTGATGYIGKKFIGKLISIGCQNIHILLNKNGGRRKYQIWGE